LTDIPKILWTEAWDRLEGGALREGVLATVALTGGAAARLVILRRADRDAAEVDVHTDAASAKVAEIARAPEVTLLVWDAERQLQIRFRARATVRPGRADEWARVPGNARLAYGGTPAPGQPIGAPADHDPTPDPARFAVITMRTESADLLRLDPGGHQRAVFSRKDGFTGLWVAP
jgi:hypothetical protein